MPGQFAAEVFFHQRFDPVPGKSQAEEIVELGYGGFGGHVVAADCACPGQCRTGSVGAQLDGSLLALGADGNDSAVVGSSASS